MRDRGGGKCAGPVQWSLQGEAAAGGQGASGHPMHWGLDPGADARALRLPS